MTNQAGAWKTYTNTQYGFGFDYPPNVDVSLNSYGAIKIIHTKDKNTQGPADLITIGVKDNPTNLSLSEWWKKNNNWVVDTKNINVNGIDALESTMKIPGGSKDILIAKNDKIIQFSTHGFAEEDQILSTFKFITSSPDKTNADESLPSITYSYNPSEGSTWKTYTDQAYGFTFKYPSNWIPEDNFNADDDFRFVDSKNADHVAVQFFENDKTLQQFMDSFSGAARIDLKYRNITLGTKTGIQRIEPDETGTAHVSFVDLPEKKGVLVIDIFSGQNDAENLTNQILSTFQFTK